MSMLKRRKPRRRQLMRPSLSSRGSLAKRQPWHLMSWRQCFRKESRERQRSAIRFTSKWSNSCKKVQFHPLLTKQTLNSWPKAAREWARRTFCDPMSRTGQISTSSSVAKFLATSKLREQCTLKRSSWRSSQLLEASRDKIKGSE